MRIVVLDAEEFFLRVGYELDLGRLGTTRVEMDLKTDTFSVEHIRSEEDENSNAVRLPLWKVHLQLSRDGHVVYEGEQTESRKPLEGKLSTLLSALKDTGGVVTMTLKD